MYAPQHLQLMQINEKITFLKMYVKTPCDFQ